MKFVKVRLIGVLTLSSMLASCGSESEALRTGIFSDSPVAGLSYATASRKGVTDADGAFNYRDGELVVFRIGGLALPPVVATDFLTPLDMADSDDITDPSVVNIARLLQSLDEDNDPDNGITIPQAAVEAFPVHSIFDPTDNQATDAAVALVYGSERQAVSADAAVSHFASTLSANAGSTGSFDQLHYLVPEGDTFAGESVFIDEQGFALSVDGEEHAGSVLIDHGVYQLSGDNNQWFVSVTETVGQQLACFSKAPVAVADCDGELYHVFKDEQVAMGFGVSEEATAAATDDTDAAAGAVDTVDLVTGAANEAVDNTDANSEAPVDSVTDSSNEATPQEFAACDAGVLDDDNDGYGWQNNESCLIVVDTDSADETSGASEVAESNGAQATADIVVPVESPVEAVVDNNSSSTVVDAESDVDVAPVQEVVASAPETSESEFPEPESSEPEASEPEISEPVVSEPEVSEPVVSEPEIVESEISEPAAIQASDITDIIVLTGQSNAAGLETGFDAVLDTGDERLFAYGTDGQWQKAELDQYWDVNLPSNFASVENGRQPYNNLAFQTGKSLAEKSDRVVGIIMITAPGEGISHWDYNSAFYQSMRTKVSEALAQLPNKVSVDAVIWMQGETDWLAEGSADPGATGFTSTDSDFYRNYYPNKLNQLISNLRSEFWYDQNAQFICGETKQAALNTHLMSLNDDGDDRTSCAQASDLPTLNGDQYGNHFSAAGLRTLGSRIADLFIAGD